MTLDSSASALRNFGLSYIHDFIGLLHTAAPTSIAETLLYDSYWHPNGFLKITVRKFDKGPRLRLHYWPSMILRRSNAEDIHTHRWSYWSRVVTGQLRIETYELSPDNGEPHLSLQCSRNVNGQYVLIPKTTRHLKPSHTSTLAAGSEHFGDPSTIHRAVPACPSPILTVFVQSAPTQTQSYVHQKIATERSPQLPPTAPTVTEIVESLRLLLRDKDNLRV